MGVAIAQNTSYVKTFIMVLSSDHLTGATGKTVTVQLSKSGSAYAVAEGSVSEVGHGRYACAYTPTDTGIVGDLGLFATAAGCDPTDETDQVLTNVQAAAQIIATGFPAVPNVTNLVTEAWRRCGVPDPTPAQLQRAENDWLEDVKREIAAEKRWHGMEETKIIITTAYLQGYPIPTPLMRVLSIWFFDGGHKGTAQGGSTTGITLKADETISRGSAQGRKLFTTGGTGAGQSTRIVDYNETTKFATCALSPAPASDTTYMISDTELKLNGPNPEIPRSGTGNIGYIQQWEEYEGEILFHPVPDRSDYALEVRGIVDISLVDKADPRILRMLREWRTAILYGVMEKISEDQSDKENEVTYGQKKEMSKLRTMKEDSRMRRRITGTATRGPGGLPRRRV